MGDGRGGGRGVFSSSHNLLIVNNFPAAQYNLQSGPWRGGSSLGEGSVGMVVGVGGGGGRVDGYWWR